MLFWHGNAHNNGQASRQNIGLLAQVTASPASTLCLILAMAFPAGATAGGRSGQMPCCAAQHIWARWQRWRLRQQVASTSLPALYFSCLPALAQS